MTKGQSFIGSTTYLKKCGKDELEAEKTAVMSREKCAALALDEAI